MGKICEKCGGDNAGNENICIQCEEELKGSKKEQVSRKGRVLPSPSPFPDKIYKFNKYYYISLIIASILTLIMREMIMLILGVLGCVITYIIKSNVAQYQKNKLNVEKFSLPSVVTIEQLAGYIIIPLTQLGMNVQVVGDEIQIMHNKIRYTILLCRDGTFRVWVDRKIFKHLIIKFIGEGEISLYKQGISNIPIIVHTIQTHVPIEKNSVNQKEENLKINNQEGYNEELECDESKKHVVRKGCVLVAMVSITLIIGAMIYIVTYNLIDIIQEGLFSQQATKDKQEVIQIVQEVEVIENERDYKTSCSNFTFEEMARYPQKYIDKRVYAKGEVIQYLEKDEECLIRVNITEDVFFWKDTIFLIYTKNDYDGRLLEGDLIEFWGEGRGLYTYENVMKQGVTLPKVEVAYLNLITEYVEQSEGNVENVPIQEEEVLPNLNKKIEPIQDINIMNNEISGFREDNFATISKEEGKEGWTARLDNYERILIKDAQASMEIYAYGYDFSIQCDPAPLYLFGLVLDKEGNIIDEVVCPYTEIVTSLETRMVDWETYTENVYSQITIFEPIFNKLNTDRPGVIERALLDEVQSASSSSVLKDNSGRNYAAQKAIDNDSSTAWVEGVVGNGEGEWLKLDLGGTKTIQEIWIENGLTDNEKNYYANNRVKKVQINFLWNSIIVELADHTLGPQVVDLEGIIESEFVEVVILETYPGSKYEDTCISEVSVLCYKE